LLVVVVVVVVVVVDVKVEVVWRWWLGDDGGVNPKTLTVLSSSRIVIVVITRIGNERRWNDVL